MDPLARDRLILSRALALLGLDPAPGLPDENRIRHGFHCRMLKHHPDRDPGNPRAHEITALLGEACAVALGKNVAPYLLRRDDLVQSLLDDPVSPLDNAPTYEEWLRERFYDLEHKSLWPY